MLNIAQRKRVVDKIASALNCTVRVRFEERTHVTGTLIRASFERWDDDTDSAKGRLALFKITVLVKAATGDIERHFNVNKLPFGVGVHALDAVEYLRSVHVKY